MASLRTLVSFLALAFVLFRVCEAKDILVGGSENAWKIPDNSSDSLDQWARKTRFKVGDFLIFKYDGKVDSVLQVTKESYESCNTSKPIKEYKESNNSSKVELDKSGPFYFISGADGHCQKGQKLPVVVMSEKHRDHDNPPTVSPTPSTAPPPAKTSSTSQAQPKKGGCFLALTSLLGFAFAYAFV